MKSITSLKLPKPRVLYLSLSQLNKPAHAITPPDSCFAFNSTTGTITDYYSHENNDSS